MNKEFVNLTANQRLMELLASINHQIAYKMVECVKFRWKSPISFLDFGDTNDTISFVNSSKVWELMDKYGDDYKIQAWVSNRSCIKIGKAIKMIYGDSFPINHPKGAPEVKPKIDIESFVNMFKAERDKNKNYERFELVKGRDIKYWYNQKNYSRFIQEDTTLAKSCLRYEESGKFLEMYVNNPDLVNMLILKDDVDRLRGRALVWYLTYPEGRIYMERIYTINDSDVELYKKYAREQGWLYKSRQTYGFHHTIVDGKTNEEYCWENFPMRIQLKRKPVSYYPYLDTLCVYNPDTAIISNEGKLLRRPPYLKLSDHQGSYIDEADHREMVFSRHFNDEIAREEAYFVDLDQDWVFSQDVVYVNNSGGKKSHRNSPLICESNVIGNRKYFLKDDCVWSEHLKTFIYKESSREAYADKRKNDKVIIHRRMIGKYFEIDSDGDIVKKKVDTKETFEQFLEGRGKSMKTKRSELEKLYREWDYNRTIHWDKPADEDDTEEITPSLSFSRRYGDTTAPWGSYDGATPSPRRRFSSSPNIDALISEPRPTEPDISSDIDLTGRLYDLLTNSLTVGNHDNVVGGTREGQEPPQVDMFLSSPPIRNRFTVRPNVQAVSNEPQDTPNTSAQGTDPNATNDVQSTERSTRDQLRYWTNTYQQYTWNDITWQSLGQITDAQNNTDDEIDN